ncbi:MAG: DUF2344 domain-containing protein [Lachnospiraceae bacterium]|nr:DUF2344 domain-containing protein [Lachnospiraceae bacterium]
MKARIKFTKCGSMRFIGHLDVMRYFQKAFRRAEIPVSYSRGFSPHQLMSFTSPLGIGLSSDAEYMDLTLDEAEEPERMVERINAQMNDEIRVRDFTVLRDEAKPSMAMLAACDYVVAAKKHRDSFLQRVDLLDLLDRFLGQDKIEIHKKTKRSEKLVDIRENIYHLSADKESLEKHTGVDYGTSCLEEELYKPLIYMQLTAGSVVNIKPELVLEAMAAMAGEDFDVLDVQIHRMEMYGDLNGKKGEVHTLSSETTCKLVPMSEYDKI